MEHPAPPPRRSPQRVLVAVAMALACLPAGARAQTPDASTAHRAESGRTGFVGGGTLARPPLRQRWRAELGQGVTSPVVVGDRIYTTYFPEGAAGSTVVSLDAATGEPVWTRSFAGASKLAYGEGRLVVLTKLGGVAALDAETGVTRWTRQLVESSEFTTSPAVHDGVVYVSMAWSGGSMWALSLEDGSTRFVDGSLYWRGAPAVRGGLAFDSDGCGTVAVDARTGEQVWRAYEGCSSFDGEIATAGGHVVIRERWSSGFVLDGAGGKLLDSLSLTGSPAIAGDVLVHPDGELLRARSLQTGLDLWAAPGNLSSAPFVVDHVVYAGTRSGDLVAHDLATGAELWRDQVQDPATTAGYEHGPGHAGMGVGGGALAVTAGRELVVYEAAAPAPGAGTRIVSGPEGPQRLRTATFEFVSPLPTQCRLDGGDWSPCTATAAYALLDEGSHSFEVRAIDALGVPQALDHRGFSIDTTPPTTEITGGPTALTPQQAATFAFETVDAFGSECSLDGADWTRCDGAVQYEKLDDGEHDFRVRSFDFAGNVEGTPQRRRWRIDSTPPMIEVTGAPPRFGRDRDASVSFETNEPADTTCSLQDVTEPCRSPVEYEDLPDGTHHLYITARDRAGNSARTVVSWTVDNLAPESRISYGPREETHERRGIFYFSVIEVFPNRAECRLDAGEWEACSVVHGHETDELDDGPHTFRVRGIDAAGNVEPEPAEWNWTVDTDEPGIVVDGAPPPRTSSTSASVAFHADEPVRSTTCTWDGDEGATCVSPTRRAELADGEHTVVVEAIDRAGNVGRTVVSWYVDTTGPDTRIDSGPPPRGQDRTPTFEFSSADRGSAFECRMDGGTWFACESGWTSEPLPDGEHTFRARALDDLGNADASPATHAFVVDNQAPAITVDAAPPARTAARDASIAFSTGGRATCAWDGGAPTACSSPASRSGLADGPHALVLRAVDEAGNENERSIAWTVDTQAPDTAVDSGPSGPTGERRVTYAFSSPEAGARFQCALDGSRWFDCASPWTSRDLAAGTHVFSVRALDDLGNADATPASRVFAVQGGAARTPPKGHRLIDPGARGRPGSARAAAVVLGGWLSAQRGAALARRRRFALPFAHTRDGTVTITLRAGRRVVARGRTTVAAPMAWARLEFLAAQRSRVRRVRALRIEVVFRPAGAAAERAGRRATLRR